MMTGGFMDYLSYLTLKATHPGNGQPKGNGPDYIVLNSVSNVGKAIPVLKEYKSALCLLDNDSAGRQAFQQMAQAGCPVRDKSDCYREYNDLNDYRWAGRWRRRTRRIISTKQPRS